MNRFICYSKINKAQNVQAAVVASAAEEHHSHIPADYVHVHPVYVYDLVNRFNSLSSPTSQLRIDPPRQLADRLVAERTAEYLLGQLCRPAAAAAQQVGVPQDSINIGYTTLVAVEDYRGV